MSVDNVNDVEPRVQYTASAAQTAFDYPFPIFADADLVVDIDGVTQALTTDYAVTGEGDDAGGTVTLTVAATGGEIVTIYRDLPIERTTDFQQNGRFASASFNDELDRITMILQQLESADRRALRISQSDATSSTDMQLPSVASRASKFLYFNAAGDPEPATGATAGSVLSQSTVGTVLYTDQTTAELAAGVTPSNPYWPPGDIRRTGALCDGLSDDTAAINLSLSVGGRVYVPSGLSTKASLLTMGVANTELVLEAGATLENSTATNKLITVSGANCAISGPGRLLGPASWLGTNTGEPTMAVLWVTGAGFTLMGVTMENIYKAGLFLNDATNCRVIGNRFIGNFPYASYGGTNTGHWAVLYDPPTSSYADIVGLVVSDNLIESCVQGVGIGNFGSTPYEAGVTISGNRFAKCWDHGVYSQNGEGTQVTGNSFVDCHSPIVVQGVSPVVSGNSIYAVEPSQTNGQQFISIRDATNAVVTGNALYGLAAAIYVDCVDGTDLSGNVVANNTIISTGAGSATSGIRLGNLAQTCVGNVIEGNYVSGGDFGEFVGAIQLEMAATYIGQNNVVRNNVIKVTNKAYGINLLQHDDAVCEGNVLEFTHSAAGAATYIMLNVDGSDNCLVARNTFIWRTGGTNITARGINVGAGSTSNRIEDNRFRLTSGSLTASDEVVDSGTTTVTVATLGEVAANVNTPSGATAQQLPLYDAGGTLIGYIPVYASAW